MSDPTGQTAVRLTVQNVESTDPADQYGQAQSLDHFGSQEQIFIGRSPSNDVALPANSVSGKHACIARQGGDFFICDMQSRNGTLLNSSQLTPNEYKPLRSGDTILISPYQITVHFGLDVLAENTSENTQMLQQQLLKEILPGLLDYEEVPPKLVLVAGYSQNLLLELVGLNTEFKIGRAPNCDLVVQDENISREHAVFRRLAKGVFVRDNNSRNGVLINGQRISRNTEVRINDRDEIVLGTIKFRFDDPEGKRIDNELGGGFPAEQPQPAAAAATPQLETPNIPMPNSPPPEPYRPPGTEGSESPEGAEGTEGVAEQPSIPDAPPPGEEPKADEQTDDPPGAEGGENDAEDGATGEEDAPVQHPAGLTGAQKAIIGVLVALLLLGGVLLFFFTGN